VTATIRDVARRAGVSPITASRAFSGTHPVAEETRCRVFAAAEELGYVPDLLARGLVHGRSPMIGMVVLELANPFVNPIIDGVQAVAFERDHLLIVNQSLRSLEMEEASLSRFRQMRVAGVLVAPVSPDLRHLEELRAQGVPVVVFSRRWAGGDYVTVDDREGGRIAGEHLVRLGHRRVGFVALGEAGNTAVEARLEGLLEALQRGGAVCRPEWRLFTRQQTPEDGIAAADLYAQLAERPTAVFVAADRVAIGFVHRLRERGLRVPEDVAVVGYDDIHYSQFLEVPLTTVALPKHELGRRAAQILFGRIEANDVGGPPQQVLLQPRLVVRRSCGAGVDGR
jgi:LacI family transcriptional regulator